MHVVDVVESYRGLTDHLRFMIPNDPIRSKAIVWSPSSLWSLAAAVRHRSVTLPQRHHPRAASEHLVDPVQDTSSSIDGTSCNSARGQV